MILGLVISTSSTGWCILDKDTKDVIDIGFIDLSKRKSLFDKAEAVMGVVEDIVIRHKISEVAIEQNLQSFRSGFSSAHTLSTLSKFNGIVSYIVFLLTSIEPRDINVSTARKSAGIKVQREKVCGVSTKDQVLSWAMNEVKTHAWPTKIISRGKNKGKTVHVKQCYDMADAYVIAKAASVMNI